MRVYFINPIGFCTPLLFETFIPTFIKEGHDIVNEVKDADVVFIDLHTRIGSYDENVLEIALHKKIVVFDFWDYGGCEDGTHIFPYINTVQLDMFLCQSIGYDIWFVRKLDKTKHICSKVYPIELIQYPDHVFEPVNKEELCSRKIDVSFIGNTSPTRINATHELDKYFKCDTVFVKDRIPHDQWLNRHRQSKLFLEACGGGFGSERPFQLITISPMLRVRRNQLTPNDFTDWDDCIEINEIPTKEDLVKLENILNDDDKLYSIYLKGIERMKTYFNAKYRANYILDVLKQNNII